MSDLKRFLPPGVEPIGGGHWYLAERLVAAEGCSGVVSQQRHELRDSLARRFGLEIATTSSGFLFQLGDLRPRKQPRWEYSFEQLRTRARAAQPPPRPPMERWPARDHAYWFEDGARRLVGLAFHTYELTERNWPALRDEYATLGFIAERPGFPSWWFPPATKLVWVTSRAERERYGCAPEVLR